MHICQVQIYKRVVFGYELDKLQKKTIGHSLVLG